MVEPRCKMGFLVSTFSVLCQFWHEVPPFAALLWLEYADMVLLTPQPKEKKPKGRGIAFDSSQELDQH